MLRIPTCESVAALEWMFTGRLINELTTREINKMYTYVLRDQVYRTNNVLDFK